MSKTKFSSEDQEVLRKNKYTYKVTENTLFFTKEFKELFWKEYSLGKLPRDIVSGCGYQPEMLGESRIEGILYCIKRQMERYGEVSEEPHAPSLQPVSSTADGDMESELKRLSHEVEYLKQEMEFLKKISSLKTTRK